MRGFLPVLDEVSSFRGEPYISPFKHSSRSLSDSALFTQIV